MSGCLRYSFFPFSLLFTSSKPNTLGPIMTSTTQYYHHQWHYTENTEKYWETLKNTEKYCLPPPSISAWFSNYKDTPKLLILIISSPRKNLIFTQKSKLVNPKGVMTIEVSYHLYHLLHKIFPILNNVTHCQCHFSVQHKFELHLRQCIEQL